ncbi:MAG: DNA mismatch repair endonuclease MutL [Desulfobaccales bacterium]|nr:DNA mismatch repair endonuclease MutL [Desulfobaccales bacterium]
MGRILILDPQVAAQIAAGEVISRPAAVVKELVENALDAGAQTITVETEEGGRRRIRVVDDGCGMTPEEAPLSLERHATSKLKAESDLLNITTLGFRGEALPSIAAVSRLELITRSPEAKVGYRLVAQAGELQEAGPWAAPIGTQVAVEDLFFNTPARRKFLKSRETESAYILESLRHLALGYPQVHFLLKNPVKTLLAAPSHSSLRERVAALFGPDLAARLLPVALGQDPFKVAGLLSDPDFSLASTRFQVFLVNRRAVQDRLLGAVLKEVYQGLLPKGRHGAAVVLLTLPADRVDVNVHPAKAEVRFQDPGRVYALLLAALRQGLGPLQGAGPRYTVTWQPESSPRAAEGALPLMVPPASPSPSAFIAPEAIPALTFAAPPSLFRFQDLAVIGQLKNTYILAQGPHGLILIDQHAAHERILYEALKSKGPEAARQPLLFPRVIEVPPAQADWLKEHLSVLSQAGLELEPFGGAAFLLTAAPAVLPVADLEAVVLAFVEALAPLKSAAQPQPALEQALTLLACHGAIKAGQHLTREEIQALLTQLDGLEVSSHCPHGRPVWRLISYGEIHRSFRRPQD